ncbi:hypothetical protein GLOTRDRAFT_91487 [Gloeophyllum trabeum ATCC 11539]|uniref:Uncharacterized protein n=1 Tax=Gloeophyllum trabeum (strain ATCC 11539 / FP-39264 / Madison 617) TaxID=670483 RepID=S7RTA5_GLOTA|nr:uncharacterized protein GLOTRDRAFT_91487 [Gloeophyllum trabeum ATCC 11539]EPQ57920.1 hypothetical protein GLOTRDRAFT_91487 [Gloeophyllum trabeum ATCC 11539]
MVWYILYNVFKPDFLTRPSFRAIHMQSLALRLDLSSEQTSPSTAAAHELTGADDTSLCTVTSTPLGSGLLPPSARAGPIDFGCKGNEIYEGCIATIDTRPLCFQRPATGPRPKDRLDSREVESLSAGERACGNGCDGRRDGVLTFVKGQTPSR